MLSLRACRAFRLTAIRAGPSLKLFHQLLGMLQVLLCNGSRLLCDLGQLALSLLFDNFKGSDHVHMGTNGGCDETLVKLGTSFLLKLFAHRLCLPLNNLAVNLH